MFIKLRALNKENLVYMIENECLRDGQYLNIASGLLFYDGSDMSRLIPDTGLLTLAELGGLSEGQVWQSAFKNWVYESGIILNDTAILRDFDPPIRVSGVFVDGRFCPSDPLASGFDATCSHTIDFINGRIIFDAALPLTTNVHATFAAKETKVTVASKFNDQLVKGILETQFTTNPRTSNILVYPSGATRVEPYPIIFIEDVGRTWDAYQLGDRSLIARDEIIFTVYALDDVTRDNLVDLISFQDRKPFLLIDFNIAPQPLSGIANTLSPEYIPYVRQLRNPVIKGGEASLGFRGWLEDTQVLDLQTLQQDNQSEVFQVAEVRSTLVIYTIQPPSPVGIQVTPPSPKCD